MNPTLTDHSRCLPTLLKVKLLHEPKASTLSKLSFAPAGLWLALSHIETSVSISSKIFWWHELVQFALILDITGFFASCWLWFALSIGNLYSEEGRPQESQGRGGGFCTFQVAFAVFSILWSLQILRWVSRAHPRSTGCSIAKGRRDGDPQTRRLNGLFCILISNGSSYESVSLTEITEFSDDSILLWNALICYILKHFRTGCVSCL